MMMSTTEDTLPRCHFVVAVSREDVLAECLLRSPVWQGLETPASGVPPLHQARGVGSAAEAFNPVMDKLESAQANEPGPAGTWLVWVHQDVHLPAVWLGQWRLQLAGALARWPRLAVAGVYGLHETDEPGRAVRAGAVVDRGSPLREAAPLPHQATSLDELLVAVRVGSGLRMDAALGFDFYATDLCLQAGAHGWDCAVLDACCEHHSSTPRSGAVPRRVVERIAQSGGVFEAKWAHRLPLCTPCFDIRGRGDVAAFLAAHTTPVDEA